VLCDGDSTQGMPEGPRVMALEQDDNEDGSEQQEEPSDDDEGIKLPQAAAPTLKCRSTMPTRIRRTRTEVLL
jgi:hypothetical protein